MEIKTTRLMPVESRLETIHRPKAGLDLRGLIMHAYHGSRDPDAILAADGRTLVKRASFGLFAATLFTLFVIPVAYWLVYVGSSPR